MATVDLAWTDNSDNEDGFKVYRSEVSSPSFPGDYTEIADISSPNSETYTDSTAPTGTGLTYAVTAYNVDGESDATVASITTESGSGPELATASTTSATAAPAQSQTTAWTLSGGSVSPAVASSVSGAASTAAVVESSSAGALAAPVVALGSDENDILGVAATTSVLGGSGIASGTGTTGASGVSVGAYGSPSSGSVATSSAGTAATTGAWGLPSTVSPVSAAGSQAFRPQIQAQTPTSGGSAVSVVSGGTTVSTSGGLAASGVTETSAPAVPAYSLASPNVGYVLGESEVRAFASSASSEGLPLPGSGLYAASVAASPSSATVSGRTEPPVVVSGALAAGSVSGAVSGPIYGKSATEAVSDVETAEIYGFTVSGTGLSGVIAGAGPVVASPAVTISSGTAWTVSTADTSVFVATPSVGDMLRPGLAFAQITRAVSSPVVARKLITSRRSRGGEGGNSSSISGSSRTGSLRSSGVNSAEVRKRE